MTTRQPLLLAATIAMTSIVDVAQVAGGEAVRGVTADPCEGVPLEPTVAHKVTPNAYDAWMHDWLSLDWGQLCRYRAENMALPETTAHRVVFLGDSITEGWKPSDLDFFTKGTLDRGISGQTTSQMLVRLRADVLALQPAVVHIMAGTNDIAGNTGPISLQTLQGNIASLAEQARAHGARIILASIPPAAQFPWNTILRPSATIVAMNTWLRDYATREHMVYADYYAALEDGHGGLRATLSEDGVHPNAAGYAAMRPIALAAIKQALSQQH